VTEACICLMIFNCDADYFATYLLIFLWNSFNLN